MRLVPTYVKTLGAILDEGDIRIIARCPTCGFSQQVDVERLADRVGRAYSLVNRRSPCRRKCGGWITFRWTNGTWDWPMWDRATDERWLFHGGTPTA